MLWNNYLLLALPLFGTATAQQQVPIGQWRDHFPYTSVVAVAEGGDNIFAATATGVFKYDRATAEVTRINKTNLLSDVGVQGLAWNDPLKGLLVYYTNGNLDLIIGSTAYNIGDIERSSIIGNKGVYSVLMQGTTAYLGCGFGIVVLDLTAREVRQTWFIGPSGSQVRVNGITMTADSIYAATEDGLFVASRAAPNLASFDNWRKREDMGTALANGPFNAVAFFGDKLLLNARRSGSGGDSLLVLGQDGVWSRFAPLFGRKNVNLNVSTDQQLVVIPHGTDVHAYGPDMMEIWFRGSANDEPLYPFQAIRSGGAFWIADARQGLLSDNGNVGRVLPNGPLGVASWRMDSAGGMVYVASGAVTGTWDNTFRKDGIYIYKDGLWSTINNELDPVMNGVNEYAGTVNDIVAVAVDPDDPTHAYVGSWDEGVIEIRNGAAQTIFNPSNSSLGYDINPFMNRLYVAGLDFDTKGTLWASNAWSDRPISARDKNGTWYSFDPGSLLNGNLLLSDVLAARNGYKWILRPRGNGILVYDSGTSLESTDDDQYKILNNQTGSGGLPAPDVYSIAEDLDQQVWVGTSRGVAVFYSPSAIFSGDDFDAQQILIEQDGNVQILLETEAVNALAVDGANRKWIGTQASGVFLVSPDGREEIRHFTAENSPLPSNTIVNLTVDGLTGEVYIGTDKGIMSFRSDATEGSDESACTKVFPNPVRETYTGPIAITGLVRDSEVKITDVSGNLVYRTSSQGGQAIWDGNDMGGRRAATGVYLVFASDPSGTFTCNTKLLLVR